jgi:predicted ATPase/DNA-binding SARP family transcriptional activator
MNHLAFYFLGSPRLERNGQIVAFDTRKALALLAYLAISGQAHSRDALAGLLWPDYDQAHARGALRRTLSTLQKALNAPLLAVSRERIGLNPHQAFWCDALEFRRRLAESAAHQHAARLCDFCRENLDQALRLYQGDFLAGFALRDSPTFDDWQYLESESFRRALASALEKLTIQARSAGEYEPAIGYAHRWLALDPLREEAHRALMQSFALSGQRNAALRQYRECARILDQELGVSPLEETTRLYQAILENRLPTPAQAHAEIAETALPGDSALPGPSFPAQPPLVGRAQQWQALLEAYQASHANGGLLLLQGEAGIGKTRLAEDFLHYARQGGAMILTARCFEGEKELAYAPLIQVLQGALHAPVQIDRLRSLSPNWLSEAARLLPELLQQIPGLKPPTSLESPAAQSLFQEGLRQVLLALSIPPAIGRSPSVGVIFLDDLQWMDDATLSFLGYLMHRLQGHSLFVLATWRNEGSLAEQRIATLIARLRRTLPVSILDLPRLALPEIAELLSRLSVSLPPGFQDRLYQETEGVPFFVVSYLEATLRERQSGEVGRLGDGWSMPASVRELLSARLRQVDETSRQLLSAAAVIGRSFDFDTLAYTSGRSEAETLAGLEALIQTGLVIERSEASAPGALQYDFSHERLRTMVFEDTSQARRRLLHRRTAEALLGRARSLPDGDSLASQIAAHYLAAGLNEQAAEFFRLAGERSRRLYAHRQALGNFQSALAVGSADAASLHEAIGDAHTWLGEYDLALASYEIAAARCPAARLGYIEHRLGEIDHRRGAYLSAISHFQAASEHLASGDAAGQARLFADWSRSAHRLGQAEQAIQLAQQALQLAQQADNTPALAQAHNMLGMLARSRQDLPQARRHLEQSLAFSQASGDLVAQAAAMNNLSLVLSESNALPQAIDAAQAALVLCSQAGDFHRQAALHNNLADLYHRIGQEEQAMDHLRQAVVIFAQVGSQAGESQPEIWKLTDW